MDRGACPWGHTEPGIRECFVPQDGRFGNVGAPLASERIGLRERPLGEEAGGERQGQVEERGVVLVVPAPALEGAPAALRDGSRLRVCSNSLSQ